MYEKLHVVSTTIKEMVCKMLAQICNNLAKMSSSNDKILYLSRVIKSDPWIADILKYTYDSSMQFYVGKKSLPNLSKIPYPTNNSINSALNERSWSILFRDILYRFTTREISGQLALDTIVQLLSFINNENDRVLLCRIFLKDLKIKMGASLINKAYNIAFGIKDASYEYIPTPDTQLCQTYDPLKKYKDAPSFYYASRKLNGLRGKFVYNRRDHTYRFITREDNPLYNFDFITKELMDLCTKYDVDYVDGEIYSDVLSFTNIISLALGNSDSNTVQNKRQLQYNIFYVGKKKQPYDSTATMVDLLNSMRDSGAYQYLKFIDYEKVDNNPQAIINKCNQFSEEGFEGIVLRHPDISWEKGRKTSLLKFKNFKEMDMVVVDKVMGEVGKEWESYIVALTCVIDAPCTIDSNGVYHIVDNYEDGDEDVVMTTIQVNASLSRCPLEDKKFVTDNFDKLFKNGVVEVRYQDVIKRVGSDMCSLQFATYEKLKTPGSTQERL